MNRRQFLKLGGLSLVIPFVPEMGEGRHRRPRGSDQETVLRYYVERFEKGFADVIHMNHAFIRGSSYWPFGFIHEDPLELVHQFGQSLLDSERLMLHFKPEGMRMVDNNDTKSPYILFWRDYPTLYNFTLCTVCGTYHPDGWNLYTKERINHVCVPKKFHSIYCRFRVGDEPDYQFPERTE